ncbi:hypothetical protein PAPHI01_1707 [Pancytospora philotis]|nr:hypothetical protein PAPHI01_1707 [Pancytospora philotis]
MIALVEIVRAARFFALYGADGTATPSSVNGYIDDQLYAVAGRGPDPVATMRCNALQALITAPLQSLYNCCLAKATSDYHMQTGLGLFAEQLESALRIYLKQAYKIKNKHCIVARGSVDKALLCKELATSVRLKHALCLHLHNSYACLRRKLETYDCLIINSCRLLEALPEPLDAARPFFAAMQNETVANAKSIAKRISDLKEAVQDRFASLNSLEQCYQTPFAFDSADFYAISPEELTVSACVDFYEKFHSAAERHVDRSLEEMLGRIDAFKLKTDDDLHWISPDIISEFWSTDLEDAHELIKRELADFKLHLFNVSERMDLEDMLQGVVERLDNFIETKFLQHPNTSNVTSTLDLLFKKLAVVSMSVLEMPQDTH